MSDINKVNSLINIINSADGYEILNQEESFFLRKTDEIHSAGTPNGTDSNNVLFFYTPNSTISINEGALTSAELSLNLINTTDSNGNSTQIYLHIIEPLLFTQPEMATTCICYRTRVDQSS